MIYISIENIKDEIAQKHIEHLLNTNVRFLESFLKFLEKKESFFSQKLSSTNNLENEKLKEFLEELMLLNSLAWDEKLFFIRNKNSCLEIKKLLIGEISALEIFVKFIGEIELEEKEDYKFFIDYYKKFRSTWKSWNGSAYSEMLKLRTCPYCNSSYIYNYKMKNGKLKTTAQLDHYFPKEKFPYLALSIFNLIPCCSACNLLKGDQDSMIYPFEKKNLETGRFKISANKNLINGLRDISFTEDNINIEVEGYEVSKKLFHIEERYSKHKYEAKEIIIKSKLYPPSKIEELSNFFIGDNKDKIQKELTQIIFNSKFNAGEYKDKILSKFTQDILKDLLK